MIWAAAALAAGALLKGNAAYQEGKGSAALHEMNARLARWNAVDAKRRGIETAARIRDQGASILGSQAVGFAGMNVSLESGVATDVMADTARLVALDVTTTLNNAAREAFGYSVSARNSRFQGRMAKYAGKQSAIGSLFGGAADVAGLYA